MTDVRAQAAGLPPVDSISLVPVLLGTGPSQRRMIPISTEPRPLPLYGHTNQISTLQGIIAEGSDGKLWKLLLGTVEMAQWTGPHYPCVQFRRACRQCLTLSCAQQRVDGHLLLREWLGGRYRVPAGREQRLAAGVRQRALRRERPRGLRHRLPVRGPL